MSDQKIPKEASNIFHSIMKASVKPLELTDNDIIQAVKVRFDKKIEKMGNEFILVDNDFNPQHSLVKGINEYIEYIRTHGV
jgi:hypothetical protein